MQSAVTPLGQTLQEEDPSAQDKREVYTDTYKSTASASLGVMALIISRASVSRPTVILWRITSESVALLRVFHPLPHILFAFEMRRIGGWRG